MPEDGRQRHIRPVRRRREVQRREVGTRQAFAAHAARHLKATAPDRFARAVASRLAGRADDVYVALVALADEAAATR